LLAGGGEREVVEFAMGALRWGCWYLFNQIRFSGIGKQFAIAAIVLAQVNCTFTSRLRLFPHIVARSNGSHGALHLHVHSKSTSSAWKNVLTKMQRVSLSHLFLRTFMWDEDE
jgi:hypothetical protein